ncbi:MAG: peptidoglycan bridge formation glycyltransferase FemA/FemB family protein [Candidatus Peregrinibacteria bacterium]|nr:peptidoglycan bridge formation glycyltransferase FemA/FemB family protein [Candidatus Peregrinibacteria bacterium]
MEVHNLTTIEETSLYREWLLSHPDGSLWQSPEWAECLRARGRTVRMYAVQDGERICASALVSIDRTAFNLSVWDCPRGPLWEDRGAVDLLLERIVRDATEDRALTVYLSPKRALPSLSFSLQESPRSEQPESTRILDLTLEPEVILAQMKPKGRYNIGLSEKHGMRVRHSTETAAFMDLLHGTAARDGFRPGREADYAAFLQNLPGAFLLLAELPRASADGKTHPRPIAGLLGCIWPSERKDARKTGIYYYGASSYEDRALMAPYLLQWEAMRYCKAQGCTSYDLLGIAPTEDPDHPWAGVTSFKGKFGGEVVLYPPERQIVLRPKALRLLRWKRRILG